MSQMPQRKSREAGFTLLEVLIAFALITIVAVTVYISQRDSLFSSVRTRNLLLASNLARAFIAKSEQELESKEFGVLKEEEEGKFPAPHQRFSWRREIKEQDFSALSSVVLAAQEAAQDEDPRREQDSNQEAQRLILKTFETYLKDSIRRMKITIIWEEDGNKKTLDFSTLLVRYDADLRPTP